MTATKYPPEARATYGFVDANGNRAPGHSRVWYVGQIKVGRDVVWRCAHQHHYWQYQAVDCARSELKADALGQKEAQP